MRIPILILTKYITMIEYYLSKIFKKLRLKSIFNSEIHFTSKIESGTNVVNVKMDKYSFCGYDCELINCHIGSFCSIANGVIIGGANHPTNWVSTSPVFYKGTDSVKKKFSEHLRELDRLTIVENDVWIGSRVIIKQGVRIGTGAVIGMGSVVTKDVEPYSIVVGTPAKMIRKRFDDSTIKMLLDSKWWELNEASLTAISKYIKSPDEFLKNLF
jgi:acetyltransferase-like isoleucine patch superfamily enzyme